MSQQPRDQTGPGTNRTQPRRIAVVPAYNEEPTVKDVLARLYPLVDELVRIAPTPSPVPATINLARRYDLGRATGVSLKDLAARGTQRPAPALSNFVSILDADLPAHRGTQPSGSYVVVIFEFPDRYVSLAYDESTETLTVVAPEDELAVRVPATFRALVR